MNITTSNLLKKNIIFSFITKGIIVLCNFLIVPLTINYVDKERYGIWLVITSLLQLISFFDIGLGNGLRNKTTELIENKKYIQLKYYVSTAYFVVFVVFITCSLIIILLNNVIPWNSIIGISSYKYYELKYVGIIVFVSFLFQLMLRLISSILMGDQLLYKSSIINLTSTIITLVGIYILVLLGNGTLIKLSLVFNIIPILILLIYNIYYFSTKYYFIKPDFKYVNIKLSKDIFKLGGMFFVIQIASIVQFQTGNLIISHWIGIEDVVIYNVCNRYFSLLLFIFNIITTPFWSEFTKAYIVNNTSWIKISIKKLLVYWATIMGIGLFMLIFSPYFFKIWLGGKVLIPINYSILMFLQVAIISFGSIYVAFINGVGNIKLQSITSILSPIIFIIVAYYLVKVYNLSIAGVLIAGIIANFYGPFLAPIQYKKMLR